MTSNIHGYFKNGEGIFCTYIRHSQSNRGVSWQEFFFEERIGLNLHLNSGMHHQWTIDCSRMNAPYKGAFTVHHLVTSYFIQMLSSWGSLFRINFTDIECCFVRQQSRNFISVGLGFWYKWPLSAHAHNVSVNWLIDNSNVNTGISIN